MDRMTLAIRLALLALTATAYVPLWQNGFIDWDDEQLITSNPHVVSGLTWDNFAWAWLQHEGPYWMPITWLTFQFDASLTPDATPARSQRSELCAAAFHGQNLFWHACNVQLLFGLLLHLTRLVGRSAFVAALFAAHPMHVESVAWAIERKDVLMCFFGLLSVIAYVRYVEKAPRSTVRWVWFAAMLLAYQCSLMCKPMLLTFPFVLLLLDYWPLRRWDIPGPSAVGSREKIVRLCLEKLPVFMVSAAMAVRTLTTRSVNSMPDLTFLDCLMNALAGYKNYLAATIYPVDLAILYPHRGSDWSIPSSLLGLLLVAAVSTAAVYWSRSARWLPVGWFWFLGTLFPVIGFKQGGHQAWADRFCYWPHIGLFIVLTWSAAAACQRVRLPVRLRAVAAIAVIGWMATLTWIQLRFWRDSVTVWEHAVAVTENSDLAHEHLGVAYRNAGRLEDAGAQIWTAAQIQAERRQRDLRKAAGRAP